eukprot:502718-Hanusia_phi.AAC.1
MLRIAPTHLPLTRAIAALFSNVITPPTALHPFTHPYCEHPFCMEGRGTVFKNPVPHPLIRTEVEMLWTVLTKWQRFCN